MLDKYHQLSYIPSCLLNLSAADVTTQCSRHFRIPGAFDTGVGGKIWRVMSLLRRSNTAISYFFLGMWARNGGGPAHSHWKCDNGAVCIVSVLGNAAAAGAVAWHV